MLFRSGRKAPRTLRRRASSVKPACRVTGRARPSSGTSSSSQRRASSRASRCAGWCPRRTLRSRSGGIYVMRSAVGRGTRSATSPAARTAKGRRPRSFQARTTSRVAPVYATADRAVANARRRPEHSRHRSTAQAVGAPHRMQSGGRMRTSDCSQETQSQAPGARHETQCGGRMRSRTHAPHRRARSVTCLCQLCAKFVPASSEYSSRTGNPTRRRTSLSACRSWRLSPMSNQRPSKRYAYTGSRAWSQATNRPG